MVDLSIQAYLNVHPLRQRIDDGGADAVQSARGTVRALIELAACVKGREHDTLRGNALFVHTDRYASSVV